MSPSVGKKLSLFVAVVVLIAMGAVGYVSYTFLDAKFADILRKSTLDTSTLLSSRIRNELRHVAEKGRMLTAAALEDFRNPDDQIRFLEDNLAMDDQFIALTLYRRSGSEQAPDWAPVFRLTRPEGDPAYLDDEAFNELDLKHPIDLRHASSGKIDVTVGTINEGVPVLRLAVPIVRKRDGTFTQILGIEVRQERVTAAFAEATAHFSFIVGRTGRVLSQTDPTHFNMGEDVSHLPILQMARATDAPNGNLDYFELPGGMLQYGSFHKVGYADLTVISQASRTHIVHLLRGFTRQAGFFTLACVALAAAFALIAAWGIVGVRLQRLFAAFERVRDGKYAIKLPDTWSDDEIGTFAQKLQEICNGLDARERVHGTHAKLRSRKGRALLQEGRIPFEGAKTEAFVLRIELHDLEKIMQRAEAPQLLSVLNDFHTQITSAVESHQGIVDTIRGGLIIACWGLPASGREDGDQVLNAALQIREAGKELTRKLQGLRLPAVRVAIGLHYGTVVAGHVGSKDRMEYSAFGEAMSGAEKVAAMTAEYATDFLMSGQAHDNTPRWFTTGEVSSGGGDQLALYELLGTRDRKQVEAELKRAAEEEKRAKKNKKAPETAAEPQPADEASPDEASLNEASLNEASLEDSSDSFDESLLDEVEAELMSETGEFASEETGLEETGSEDLSLEDASPAEDEDPNNSSSAA